MADATRIEWADSTFNPWMGCTKVSPACDHCYAERDTARFGRVEWGAGKPRVRTSESNWRKPIAWNSMPFHECAKCRWRGHLPETLRCPECNGCRFTVARRRVFCASLADVFDNEVNPQWRADLFDLILRTPNLDWLLLTKRIGNAHRLYMESELCTNFPRNVWLGATICTQAEADRDIPKLLATPASVRFLSIEPMLEPVKLPRVCACGCGKPMEVAVREAMDSPAALNRDQAEAAIETTLGVDWVVCGGESGPQARPMHPQWVRSLRDQCAAHGVPFLFKQWGEWAPRAGKIHRSGPDWQAIDPGCTRWEEVVRIGEHGRNTRTIENCTPDMGEEVFMQRVGKKLAGRMLDAHVYSEFPAP